jgi:hypothetical protein
LEYEHIAHEISGYSYKSHGHPANPTHPRIGDHLIRTEKLSQRVGAQLAIDDGVPQIGHEERSVSREELPVRCRQIRPKVRLDAIQFGYVTRPGGAMQAVTREALGEFGE